MTASRSGLHCTTSSHFWRDDFFFFRLKKQQHLQRFTQQHPLQSYKLRLTQIPIIWPSFQPPNTHFVSSTSSTSCCWVIGVFEWPAVGSSAFSSPLCELTTYKLKRGGERGEIRNSWFARILPVVAQIIYTTDHFHVEMVTTTTTRRPTDYSILHVVFVEYNIILVNCIVNCNDYKWSGGGLIGGSI